MRLLQVSTSYSWVMEDLVLFFSPCIGRRNSFPGFFIVAEGCGWCDVCSFQDAALNKMTRKLSETRPEDLGLTPNHW